MENKNTPKIQKNNLVFGGFGDFLENPQKPILYIKKIGFGWRVMNAWREKQ
jgi:hypothetical protein